MQARHWTCIEKSINFESGETKKFVDTNQIYSFKRSAEKQAENIKMALERVNTSAKRSEIEDLVGSVIVEKDKYEDLMKIELAHLTMIRVGIISCLFFLIAVFLSVYRYSIRLASYYEARADAAELLEGAVSTSNFIKLSEALTPKISFDKNPATPLTQLIDAVKTSKSIK
ncbi:hypothetical protein GCM10011611_02420 [Aliidongia dinghuensis]|uniref:Uncharacterized protein n=2 Tax=Aliidongia dinghuensis TaxID=1867774 RepID=A0A8J3E1B3_9PROT|nr:hypothetical protein GCM10011611_02420 [Aliidongia dinghuensis]